MHPAKMNKGWTSSGTQLLAGYLAAFGSLVVNGLSATCVQALQGAIPDFQLSAIRSIGQGLIYTIGGLIISTDFKVQRKYIPGLIYYGATFLFYNVGYFGASTYLPLGEVQGLVASISIVIAIAQSKLLLKTDIKKSIVIAGLVCVVGIVLIVQPPWLFKKMSSTVEVMTTSIKNASSTLHPLNTSSSYSLGVSSSGVLLGYVFGAVGGAGQGLMIDANGIILHDVKTLPKATYAMLVCTVGSVAFMFYLETPVYVVDFIQFMLVLGHILLSAASVFLVVYSSSIIPGPSLCVVWSFEVVTMLTYQYTIMHSIKPGHYNWIEVLGCAIIVFGASIPGVMDILVHRAKADELP